MDLDRVISGASIAAIPLLGIAVYLLRADPPEDSAPEPEPAAETASATHDDRPPASARDESSKDTPGFERPAPPPEPRVRIAAHLPVSDPARAPNAAARTMPREDPGPCGGVHVKLITRADDPELSTATLSDGSGKPAVLRRVGDAIGPWRVGTIEWNRVWLVSSSGRCAVTLHEDDGAGERVTSLGTPSAKRPKGMLELVPVDGEGNEIAHTAPSTSPADDDVEDDGARAGAGAPDEAEPSSARAHDVVVPDVVASGITAVDDGAVAITASAVTAIFDGDDDLLAGVELQPARRSGEVVGLHVSGIEPGSLLALLGLENGDLVLSLGGDPCTSADSALEILERARGDETLVVRIERRGEPMEIELRLLD